MKEMNYRSTGPVKESGTVYLKRRFRKRAEQQKDGTNEICSV
jgi:hypothetical protein